MRYKILLVDDELDNRTTYKGVLEKSGFSVLTAQNAGEAFGLAVDSKPDLVLSDVSMPGGDGLTLCRRLKADRGTAQIPVILMSGVRRGEEEQTEGIELGADDYVPKPLSPRLLCAKIHAVLRRYEAPKELESRLKTEGFELDVHARTVKNGRKNIHLTRKEFDLLTTFLRKPGRVLSAPYLLETVWGYDPADYDDPRTVGVHVSALRKKLGPRFAERLINVPGLGYRLDS